jgi:hypothetical protein
MGLASNDCGCCPDGQNHQGQTSDIEDPHAAGMDFVGVIVLG